MGSNPLGVVCLSAAGFAVQSAFVSGLLASALAGSRCVRLGMGGTDLWLMACVRGRRAPCTEHLRSSHVVGPRGSLQPLVPLKLPPRGWRAMAVPGIVPLAHKAKSWLRCMGSPGQRSLHSIQAHFPTIASSAQFRLLCYQLEPVPRSLPARLSQLTSRDPCRLQVW